MHTVWKVKVNVVEMNMQLEKTLHKCTSTNGWVNEVDLTVLCCRGMNLTVGMHSHVWGGSSNWTCTDTSCHILCLDILGSLHYAFWHEIGGWICFGIVSHKNTSRLCPHYGFSYGTREMTSIQMVCDTFYIQIPSLLYGQACVSSDDHFVQMPSHIQSTENSSLVYGQACGSSDLPFVQMSSHIQNTDNPFLVYGQACDSSDDHFVQMPSHIQSTENSSLVYEQACGSSDVHSVQMPSHIQSTGNPFLLYGQACVYSDRPFVQMPFHIQSTGNSSLVYGQGCGSLDIHSVQMPSHIQSTENTFLVYGQACVSSERHHVQMPFHIQNTDAYYALFLAFQEKSICQHKWKSKY